MFLTESTASRTSTSALLKKRLHSRHGRTIGNDSDSDSLEEVCFGVEPPLKMYKTFDQFLALKDASNSDNRFDVSSVVCVTVIPSQLECKLVRAVTPLNEVDVNTGHSKLVLRKSHSPENFPKSPIALTPLAHPDDVPCEPVSRMRRYKPPICAPVATKKQPWNPYFLSEDTENRDPHQWANSGRSGGITGQSGSGHQTFSNYFPQPQYHYSAQGNGSNSAARQAGSQLLCGMEFLPYESLLPCSIGIGAIVDAADVDVVDMNGAERGRGSGSESGRYATTAAAQSYSPDTEAAIAAIRHVSKSSRDKDKDKDKDALLLLPPAGAGTLPLDCRTRWWLSSSEVDLCDMDARAQVEAQVQVHGDGNGTGTGTGTGNACESASESASGNMSLASTSESGAVLASNQNSAFCSIRGSYSGSYFGTGASTTSDASLTPDKLIDQYIRKTGNELLRMLDEPSLSFSQSQPLPPPSSYVMRLQVVDGAHASDSEEQMQGTDHDSRPNAEGNAEGNGEGAREGVFEPILTAAERLWSSISTAGGLLDCL